MSSSIPVFNLPVDGRSSENTRLFFFFFNRNTYWKRALYNFLYSNSFQNPAGSMTCWTRYFFCVSISLPPMLLLVYCVRLSRWLTLFTHFPPGFRKSSDSLVFFSLSSPCDLISIKIHQRKKRNRPAVRLCHTKRRIFTQQPPRAAIAFSSAVQQSALQSVVGGPTGSKVIQIINHKVYNIRCSKREALFFFIIILPLFIYIFLF